METENKTEHKNKNKNDTYNQKIAQEWLLNVINILKTETNGTYQDITSMDIMGQLQRTSFGVINICFDVLHFIVKHLLINVSLNVYNTTNNAILKLKNKDTTENGSDITHNMIINENKENKEEDEDDIQPSK